MIKLSCMILLLTIVGLAFLPVAKISATSTDSIGIDNSAEGGSEGAGPGFSTSMELNHASHVMIVVIVGLSGRTVAIPVCGINGTTLTEIGSAQSYGWMEGFGQSMGSMEGLLLVYYRYVSNSGTDTISCASSAGSLGFLSAASFTGVENINPVEGTNNSSALPNDNPLIATATIGPGSPDRRIVFVSLANAYFPFPVTAQHPPCASFVSTSMIDIMHGSLSDPSCNYAAAFDMAYQDSSEGIAPTSTFNIQPLFSINEFEGLIFALLPSKISISANLSSFDINLESSVMASATLTGVTGTATGAVTYNLYPGGCSNNAIRIPIDTSTVQVTNGAVPNSKLFAPKSVGFYGLNAVYSGDNDNNGTTSSCQLLFVGNSTSMLTSSTVSYTIPIVTTTLPHETTNQSTQSSTSAQPLTSILSSLTNALSNPIVSGTISTVVGGIILLIIRQIITQRRKRTTHSISKPSEKESEIRLDAPLPTLKSASVQESSSKSFKKFLAFIAYDDATGFDLAEHLKSALEKRSITAFVARLDIPGYTKLNRGWAERINFVIATCNTFILILSTDRLSPEVRRETKLAFDRNKVDSKLSLIVARMQGVPRTSHNLLSDAGLDSSKYQQVDFLTPHELARKISLMLSEEGAATRLETPAEQASLGDHQAGPDIRLERSDLVIRGRVPFGLGVSHHHRINFFNYGNVEGQLLSVTIKPKQEIPQMRISTKPQSTSNPTVIPAKQRRTIELSVDTDANPGQRPPEQLDVEFDVKFDVSTDEGPIEREGSFRFRTEK